MRRFVVVAILSILCISSVAEAGVFSTVGSAGIWVWNLVPVAVRIVNTGVHFICDSVHTALHSTADFLQIENLP